MKEAALEWHNKHQDSNSGDTFKQFDKVCVNLLANAYLFDISRELNRVCF